MTRSRLLFTLLAGVAFPASAIHAQCAEGSPGSCFEPHDTPGCWTTECCDAVCEADAFCCDSAWDQNCVDYATKFCAGLACPGFQSCGETSSEPGCDDRNCSRLVCDHDWFCCSIDGIV